MTSSKYFDEDTLSCPHCGWQPDMGIDESLLEFLDNLQDEVDEPLEIINCVRCAEYNDSIGGYKNSYHIHGMAVDIACPESYLLDEFADLCEELKAKGVVIKNDEDYVHIDMRSRKCRCEE